MATFVLAKSEAYKHPLFDSFIPRYNDSVLPPVSQRQEISLLRGWLTWIRPTDQPVTGLQTMTEWSRWLR